MARERHAIALPHHRVPIRLELQYQLARRTAFAQLKERIGFGRTKLFITAAAPIGDGRARVLRLVDMLLREVYGQSEGTGPTTVNTDRRHPARHPGAAAARGAR